MSNVEIPDLAEESTKIMRVRPSVRQKLIQREKDRAEFFENYNNWKDETSILSSIQAKQNNEHFQNIIKMNRRAVPFIYEIIKKDVDWIVDALVYIYNEDILLREDGKRFIKFEKYCDEWCKKIEEKGDI